jgi:hypothetical protein
MHSIIWNYMCRERKEGGLPLQDVADDACIHEQALGELQRDPLRALLPHAPHRLVHLRARHTPHACVCVPQRAAFVGTT